MTEATTPPASRCPRCGADRSGASSPGGLCPTCLMQLGLPSQAEGGVPPSGSPPRPEEPARTPAELAPHFPELEIETLVGRGGMGTVYRARQRGLDRTVALKILPADAARDPAWPERFAREARALARLSHPNIVAVYDSGSRGGLYYFAMEFVDGTSLRHMIQARTTTPREALQIVAQVCDALQYAHEEGVVHRDIKPENILVDKRGRVKIADFGLAKLVKGEAADLTLTGTQQAMGTPHYMAPEQWEKPHTVDHRADIYSLGVVFYELLTGELPLGRFAAPSTKVHVDVRLDEVVLKTLAKEPERRYQQASQMKTDVDGASRRVEEQSRESQKGFLRRKLSGAVRALDPRTSSRKRIGDVEVPSTWPLGAAVFLFGCLAMIVSDSPLATAAVFAGAIFGLWYLLRNTA